MVAPYGFVRRRGHRPRAIGFKPRKHEYTPRPRPSDLTESQWHAVRYLFPAPSRRVLAIRKSPVRVLLNAMFFRLEYGVPLRQLPPDYPPWGTVHSFEDRLKKSGLLVKIINKAGRSYLIPRLPKMMRFHGEVTESQGYAPKVARSEQVNLEGMSGTQMSHNDTVMVLGRRMSANALRMALAPTSIDEEQAQQIGDRIGVDWSEIPLEQFLDGLKVELEHGSKDSQTDVTHDDLAETGMIALAHLKERPDYYTMLKKVEGKTRMSTFGDHVIPTHDSWKDLEGEDGYLYHATNLDNLHEIASDQLVPHKPWHGTDQEAWPDGSTHRRSYFTDHPSTAWSFAPEHGHPVLLRLPRSSARFRRELTGDTYTRDSIPAHHIEVHTSNGWVLLGKRQDDTGHTSMSSGGKVRVLGMWVDADKFQMSCGKHEYSSTQVNLPPDLAAEVLAFGSQIPDEELAEDGRETIPHVTVRYGLTTSEVEDVVARLDTFDPVDVFLGRVGSFPASETGKDHDVLWVGVESEQLHGMNQALDCLCEAERFPYRPHVTVAYLRPGMASKYIGKSCFVGKGFCSDEVLFSPAQGDDAFIVLDGTGAVRMAHNDEDDDYKEWNPEDEELDAEDARANEAYDEEERLNDQADLEEAEAAGRERPPLNAPFVHQVHGGTFWHSGKPGDRTHGYKGIIDTRHPPGDYERIRSVEKIRDQNNRSLRVILASLASGKKEASSVYNTDGLLEMMVGHPSGYSTLHHINIHPKDFGNGPTGLRVSDEDAGGKHFYGRIHVHPEGRKILESSLSEDGNGQVERFAEGLSGSGYQHLASRVRAGKAVAGYDPDNYSHYDAIGKAFKHDVAKHLAPREMTPNDRRPESLPGAEEKQYWEDGSQFHSLSLRMSTDGTLRILGVIVPVARMAVEQATMPVNTGTMTKPKPPPEHPGDNPEHGIFATDKPREEDLFGDGKITGVQSNAAHVVKRTPISGPLAGKPHYIKYHHSAHQAYPEVATSGILRIMGFDEVPPTHLLKHEGRDVSVTPAIKGHPLLDAFYQEDPKLTRDADHIHPDSDRAFQAMFKRYDNQAGRRHLANYLTASWLVNHSDAHGNNFLVGENGHIHPIDFGYSLAPHQFDAQHRMHGKSDEEQPWRYHQNALVTHGLVHPNHPLDKKFLQEILDKKDEIIKHAEDAIPNDEKHGAWRQEILDVLGNKFRVVQSLLKSDNPTLNHLPEDGTGWLRYNRPGNSQGNKLVWVHGHVSPATHVPGADS